MLRADQGPERDAIVTSGRNPVKYLENKICLHATVCTLSLTMGAFYGRLSHFWTRMCCGISLQVKESNGLWPEYRCAGLPLHHSGRRTTEGLHRLSDPN